MFSLAPTILTASTCTTLARALADDSTHTSPITQPKTNHHLLCLGFTPKLQLITKAAESAHSWPEFVSQTFSSRDIADCHEFSGLAF